MTLPILHTARLSLRPLEEADDHFIYSLRSNPQVNTYLDRQPPTQIEEARAFIKKISDSIADNKSYYWGIALKEPCSMIGTICLWNLSEDRKTAELGYELHPDFQGKGYMDEAIGEVIAYVYQNGFTTLEAYSHKDNAASTKLLLKHGFVLQEDRRDPENADQLIFSLNRI
jgi:ribosomal-protein-alanine N-acetyltransferase